MTHQCFGCKKEITDGQAVTLPGSPRLWHEACFNCKQCGLTMVGKSHIEHISEYYHDDCYHEQFSQKCQGCGKPIIAEYVNTGVGGYHKECLKCRDCSVALGGQFFNDNGQPKCESCFSKVAKTCGGCEKPILDQQYSALDKLWHLACFKCKACGKNFPNNQFLPHEGFPYHKECYTTHCMATCVVCQKAISGEYYQVESDNIHDKCLESYKQMKISGKNFGQSSSSAPPPTEEEKSKGAQEPVKTVAQAPAEKKLVHFLSLNCFRMDGVIKAFGENRTRESKHLLQTRTTATATLFSSQRIFLPTLTLRGKKAT